MFILSIKTLFADEQSKVLAVDELEVNKSVHELYRLKLGLPLHYYENAKTFKKSIPVYSEPSLSSKTLDVIEYKNNRHEILKRFDSKLSLFYFNMITSNEKKDDFLRLALMVR